MKRWWAAAAASLLIAVGTAGPASAELYPPDSEPSLEVEASSICIGDVPYLSWSAVVTGTESNTVTISFVNPGGANYVLSGQALSGTILWPGAVVEDGVIVDWPGWTLVDGEWVEGDEWDWVRPEVDIHFEVNPEATVPGVAYPLPSAACYGPPPGEDTPGGGTGGETEGLPNALGLTGSQTSALLGAVALLLAAGVTLVVVRRRAVR